MSEVQSWSAALLFCFCPTGSEALIWCCALGYVYSVFWTLSTIYLFFNFLDNRSGPYKVALQLLILQVAAYITWDWAILITPSLVIIALVKRVSWKNYLPLLPGAIVSGVAFLIKSAAGFTLGYQWNTPIKMIGTFFFSPLIIANSHMPKEFYTSITALFFAGLYIAFLIRTAYKVPSSRLLLALFFLWLVPIAIRGHPQSRYYYLSSLPLISITILGCYDLVKNKVSQSILYSSALALFILSLNSRIDLWTEKTPTQEIIWKPQR